MESKKTTNIVLSIILIAVGGLIIIGAMLPIGNGTLDFGFWGFNVTIGIGVTFTDINIIFNPLLGKFIVEYINPLAVLDLDILYFLGVYDIVYAAIYTALVSSPILRWLMVFVIIAGIVIALFGVLKLLKVLEVIPGAENFLGERSIGLGIIFLIAGAAAIFLIIFEFILFSTQVLPGIKSFHELDAFAIGTIFPEMNTKALPLAGFYIVLISAIGGLVVSIYLLITTRAPEQGTTTKM